MRLSDCLARVVPGLGERRRQAVAAQHPAPVDEPAAGPGDGRHPLAPAAGWSPTHRHRKGGLYRVLGTGILEADRSAAVIYDDAEGTIWIRPAVEFADGRFEALTEAS